MSRKAFRTLGLLVLGLGLAGCGGGGGSKDGGGGGGDRLSAEDFRLRANTVCNLNNEGTTAALNVAQEELSENPTAEEINAIFSGPLADGLEQQFDTLDSLVPPEELEADFDAMVQQDKDMVKALKENPAALDQEDSELNQASIAIGEAAAAMGLDKCAEGPGGESEAEAPADEMAPTEEEAPAEEEAPVEEEAPADEETSY